MHCAVCVHSRSVISFRDTRRMLSTETKNFCAQTATHRAIHSNPWNYGILVNSRPYGRRRRSRRWIAFVNFRHANVCLRSVRVRVMKIGVSCRRRMHTNGHWHFRHKPEVQLEPLENCTVVYGRQSSHVEGQKCSPFPLSNPRRKVVAILHLCAVRCARAQKLFIAHITIIQHVIFCAAKKKKSKLECERLNKERTVKKKSEKANPLLTAKIHFIQSIQVQPFRRFRSTNETEELKLKWKNKKKPKRIPSDIASQSDAHTYTSARASAQTRDGVD